MSNYKIHFWHYTPENCRERLNYEFYKKDNDSLCDYVGSERFVVWKDNYTFEAELAITDYHRGRSSAAFTLSDTHGHKYNCFMHAIFEIITDHRFIAGKITATWTFEKRGENYGIKLVK